jgi:hypothetical protein
VLTEFLSRWMIARQVDEESLDAALRAETEASPYASALRRVARRLRRESALLRQTPTADLRRRTLAAIQDAGAYRRAFYDAWWRRPVAQGAFVAAGVLCFSAVFAMLASKPPAPKPGAVAADVAIEPLSPVFDPKTDALRAMNVPFDAELDAMTLDAQRAVRFFIDQFALRPPTIDQPRAGSSGDTVSAGKQQWP